MSDDSLTWLMGWYLSQCNEDWEHQFGIKIDTLDNPGWTIKIDLEDTALEKRFFERVFHGVPAGDLDEWRGIGSWWVADVNGWFFEASCGPLDLISVIEVFRRWVESEAIA